MRHPCASMAGLHTAYYLVHSMGSTQSFEEQDRAAVQNFPDAARGQDFGGSSISAGLGHRAEKLRTCGAALPARSWCSACIHLVRSRVMPLRRLPLLRPAAVLAA
jgi:hypothetical protein